jgi:hypothetical protein
VNHQDEFDRTLRAWIQDDAPRKAPRHLLEAVVAETASRRPRIGWRARLGATAAPRALSGTGPIGRLLILVALSAALLIGMLAGVLLAGGPRPALLAVGPTPAPTPTTTPTLTPTATPVATPTPGLAAGADLLENVPSNGLVSGVTYTSNLFSPSVTFELLALGQKRSAGQTTDWCQANASARTILLSWKYGCVNQLWFIRPASVDCGTPTSHPDAAALAAAILANPGLGQARDLGMLHSKGAVPSTLFGHDYQGRVIEVGRSRTFDASTINPDQCRLLPEPGSHGPTFEVRGDLAMKLILIDVRGELVVVMVAPAGYDAATGAAAHERGYDRLGPATDYQALLTAIYDVTFSP